MMLPFTRRQLLTGSLGGIFSMALQHRCGQLFAAADPPKGRAKRCVVLWMGGGPSQFETFDPKPGTATGGPTRTIQTTVPGVEIAADLPLIATRMKDLSIIRSMSSVEGDHERGSHLLHTGYPLVQAFPRPALGAIVSQQSTPADFPYFVSIGARGFGPAYMGPDHAPFAVEDPAAVVQSITGLRSQRQSLRRLAEFNESFAQSHLDANLQRRTAALGRIERMLTTPFVKAMDIEQARAVDRERYGQSEFGDRCLLARRLLESGVRFVEVHHDGWDTHDNNFSQVGRLCSQIDRPWSTLIDDLQASGLWDETMIVWMGEFGRTPQINGNKGRDHFPQVIPVVVGGGGLRGGEVIGATNHVGLEITKDQVSVPDLFATLLVTLGIDPSHEFRTEFGATAPASDKGKAIHALLASTS